MYGDGQTDAPLRDAAPAPETGIDPAFYQGEVKSPPSWKIEEMRQKQRAYDQKTADQACARPSLRERVNSSFYRAERETRNVDRLKELADLLDRYPAIARILELIEQTGV